MVKQYFRVFLISIGLYLEFTYYFAFPCITVFLDSSLAQVGNFLFMSMSSHTKRTSQDQWYFQGIEEIISL